MIINSKHPGRNRRGEGPRVLNITGGFGPRPTFEGAALDWHLCPALTSVGRLRTVSLLCERRNLTISEVARELGLNPWSLHCSMWGLRNFHLLECHPTGPPRRRGRSEVYALEWNVTDFGRAWLWRFARMTNRLGTYSWDAPAFHGDADIPPWEALRLHGQNTLCRPAGLATARFLMDWGPTYMGRGRAQLGLPVVSHYVRKWRAMGWLTEAPRRTPRYREHVRYNERRVQFTMEAHQAIGNHVDALCWVARRCGYEGDTWVEDYLKDLHPDWFEPCGLHEP